jgi:tRNA1(Val) A37 N6-methylase TrmN6
VEIMAKGLFIGNSHANGGIPSEIAETGTKIEIEGNEYYICNEAYNSDIVFDFKRMTNKEILDYIYTEFSCKLNQDVMHYGDFIVCKIVVADKKKKDRKGTIKQILNEMQGEKNCKVETSDIYFKNGGKVNLRGIKYQLKKGIKVEQEHRKTLEKIASGDISVDEAIKQTAEDHIAENPNYYDELEKIEKKPNSKEPMNINESYYINRQVRGSGIDRIIISIAKNDDPEKIKENIEIVMSNPNFNTAEKWEQQNNEEIYKYEEKINEIKLDIEKWVKTGGDYIKKLPEYEKKITDIEALNKLIEVANSIKDFNSLSMYLDKKESEIKTDIESYKNPYQINKAIEKLLDQKRDSDNYSAKELEFISYYSGYGGLEKFGEIGVERMKGLMYEFYTPDAVVKKMWALAYKYGYGTIADNSVFEPSVGIGAFLKYAPKDVRLVANEINEYSAKICEILYPNAKVELKYFEQNFIKNNLSIKHKTENLDKYSLIIGNPPYGTLNSKYVAMGEDKFTHAANYTEYFISRGLDLLVKDGLLVYIVGAEQYNGGSLFLDSGLSKVKEIIFDKADLLDAYRLPINIFERTGVSSEIVVFKKR